jgi:hypothetical protein
MKPEITQKAIEGIRNGAQVVINDQYFGPTPTPAAAPGVK